MKRLLIALVALVATVGLRAENETVSADEFEALLKQKNVVLIDTRRPDELVHAHIPGATLMDVKSKNFVKEAKKINKKKTLAVYCRKGHRSKVAAQKLDSLGYKVVELDGGILNWIGQGKTVYEFPDTVTIHVEIDDINHQSAGSDFRMTGGGTSGTQDYSGVTGVATFCITNQSAHVSWGTQQRYMTLKWEDVISMSEHKGEMILRYRTIDDVHVVTLYVTLPGVAKIILENTAGSEKWTWSGRITNQF